MLSTAPCSSAPGGSFRETYRHPLTSKPMACACHPVHRRPARCMHMPSAPAGEGLPTCTEPPLRPPAAQTCLLTARRGCATPALHACAAAGRHAAPAAGAAPAHVMVGHKHLRQQCQSRLQPNDGHLKLAVSINPIVCCKALHGAMAPVSTAMRYGAVSKALCHCSSTACMASCTLYCQHRSQAQRSSPHLPRPGDALLDALPSCVIPLPARLLSLCNGLRRICNRARPPGHLKPITADKPFAAIRKGKNAASSS